MTALVLTIFNTPQELIMMTARTFRVPVIMMYHSVRDVRSVYRISISPARFQRHVEFLASHYRIVPLEEFLDATHSRARLEGMACITFDDGYVDNIGAAREILARQGITATVFVPTGYVGRPYFWWDAMPILRDAAAKRTDRGMKQLRVMFPSLEFGPKIDDAEWSTIWDRMRRCPLDETYRSVEELARRFRADLTGLPRPVTMTELKSLAQWPFEIGSHSISHRPLPALSLAEMRSELQSSRDYLESAAGKPIRTFSYPFGLLDRDVAQTCRDVGYTCGVSVVADDRVSYEKPFDLPRFDGADGDVDELVTRLETLERKNLRAFLIPGIRVEDHGNTPVALPSTKIDIHPTINARHTHDRFELLILGRVVSIVPVEEIIFRLDGAFIGRVHHGSSDPATRAMQADTDGGIQHVFHITVPVRRGDALRMSTCSIVARVQDGTTREETFQFVVDPSDPTSVSVASGPTCSASAYSHVRPPVVLYVERAALDDSGQLQVRGWAV
jgi:peptidoglycan/xylan/chitin deacetylase (PgdA/CDA1 family)